MFRQSTTTITNRKASTTTDQLVAGALPDRVQTARERLEHQYDPALLEALSERELAQDRELAELVREHQRTEQRARIRAAADAAERVRETAKSLADREAVDLLRAAQAVGEQRHSSSPHAKVARLYKRKPRVLALLVGVVAFSMLFSAVTVQQNIAPGLDMANPMFWLSYGLEALISAVLVALMLSTSDTSEWDVIDESKLRQVYLVEAALLLASIGLNTFPYIRAGDVSGFGIHAIAPVMIGVALITHRLVAERYGRAIEAATAAIPDHEDLQARLVALTQVGDAGNRIVPAILAPTATEHEHPSATQQALAAAQHQAPDAQQEHTAAARSSAAPVATTAAHQSLHDEQSSPATAAEHSPVSDEVVTEEEIDPATAVLPWHRTAQQAAAEHVSAEQSGPAQPADGNPAVEVRVVFEATEDAPVPSAVEHENEAVGVAVSAVGIEVAEAVAVRSTDAAQPAQQLAAQHPATAPLRSAEQRSTSAEQSVEHERSTPADAEPSAQQVRSSVPTTEQRPSAVQHSAEQTESGVLSTAVWELAREVKDATQSRSEVERIAQALAHHDATGSSSRVARDLGMGFKTVDKWVGAATEIRRAHGGARVIHLHNS
ncbi:hypothetical protein [Nocardia fluminea]|uniref:hypothetical protein n=1 Tax=Nocardia fluminea TaxID=134984 RepID=UPI00379C3FAC